MAGRAMSGSGSVVVLAPQAAVWAALQDPDVLVALIPGADTVTRLASGRFHAVLSFGVGRMRSPMAVELSVSGEPPGALTLEGHSVGGLGGGRAAGVVTLTERRPGRTVVEWSFEGEVSGPVSFAGDTLLQMSARLFTGRFFAALTRQAFF